MPKFLFKISYTAEGMQGLRKDGAAGREKAAAALCESLGGKLELFLFALGDDDVFVIADMPSHVQAAAVSANVGATGMIRSSTVGLLTVSEMDQALGSHATFRAPGA